MTNKQQEQYNTLPNADQINKETSSLPIITNEPIKDTPFRLIGNPTQGYAIALGDHRLTEISETKDETLQKLEEKPWNIIANMIVTIITKHKEIEKEEFKPWGHPSEESSD